MHNFDLNSGLYTTLLLVGLYFLRQYFPDLAAFIDKFRKPKPDSKPDQQPAPDSDPSQPASFPLIVGLIRRLLGGIKLFGSTEVVGHDDEAAVAALASVLNSDPTIAAKLKGLLK